MFMNNKVAIIEGVYDLVLSDVPTSLQTKDNLEIHTQSSIYKLRYLN